MGIVLKHSDGEYKSSVPGIFGSFSIPYAQYERAQLGYIRYIIGKYVTNEGIEGYVSIQEGEKQLCVGQKSALFVPAKHQTDSNKTKITRMEHLRKVILERMLKKNAMVRHFEGNLVLSVRVALGKMNIDDIELDLGLGDGVGDEEVMNALSQESHDRVYDSPMADKQKSKNTQSASAAVTWVDKLLQKLYTDEDSPYFHGIPTILAARVRTCCQAQHFVDSLLDRATRGDWPTKVELFGINYSPEPERFKYPPDEFGDFPQHESSPPPLSTPLDKIAVMLTQ